MNVIHKLPVRSVPAYIMAAALSFSGPVLADFSVIFPAGTACDFDLQIDGSGTCCTKWALIILKLPSG